MTTNSSANQSANHPTSKLSNQPTSVLICGAGIAGIATAYHLAVRHGVDGVLLVDERPPLSLTSVQSTECYRNWWPGPGEAMVGLMNRSIDLMEDLARESGNVFRLNRRGYLYATADADHVDDFTRAAEKPSTLGAGPVRYHTAEAGEADYVPAPPDDFEDQPTGADIILDRRLIRTHFPYLADDVVAVLHARRAGWFSAHQLGMYLLEEARAAGVRFLSGRVEGVEVTGSRVSGAKIASKEGGSTIATDHFVNAAGPFLKPVGHLLGVDLPVVTERHLKVAFNDEREVVPRDAPLLIWSDPVRLAWSDEERAFLAESTATRELVAEMPSGVHTRPEGGPDSSTILILWEYSALEIDPPEFPPPSDPYYPEVALRGLTRMIPDLQVYLDRAPRPDVDGGYYTKTRENRPLIGPLPIEGAYVIGALSGYGLMASSAAGELLADYIAGGDLPAYAPWFRLERYADSRYQALLDSWGATGEL